MPSPLAAAVKPKPVERAAPPLSLAVAAPSPAPMLQQGATDPALEEAQQIYGELFPGQEW